MQQSTDLQVAEIEGIETSSVDQLVQEMKITNALKRQELSLKKAEIQLMAITIELKEQALEIGMYNSQFYAQKAEKVILNANLA